MNIMVGCRVHLLVIDAIEDAEQILAARAQEWVQFLTERRGKYLLGITSTDGGDSIGKEDATSHNINDIGKLDDLGIEETTGGNASHFQDAVAENPLVGKIMDGIDGGGAGKEGIIPVNGMRPIGHNAGLPIVSRDDIAKPVVLAHCFDG